MRRIEVNYKQLSQGSLDVILDIAEYARPQTVEACWAKLESLRERERIEAATYDEIKQAVTFSLRPVTKAVARQEVTLEPGQRYLATRPMADRFRTEFPIRIQKLTGTSRGLMTIEGLSYEAANEFLAAFNNGGTSFEGRVW